jgi:hypothetical protein
MNHLQKLYVKDIKIESTYIRPSNSFAYIIEKSSKWRCYIANPTHNWMAFFSPLLNVVKFSIHCPTIVTSHMLPKIRPNDFFPWKDGRPQLFGFMNSNGWWCEVGCNQKTFQLLPE